jgi:peroxiredoxin
MCCFGLILPGLFLFSPDESHFHPGGKKQGENKELWPMVALNTPSCNSGWHAAPFLLPGIDGRNWSLEECRGQHGMVIAFICNHCPYVQAIAPRLAETARTLAKAGVSIVAIMPNDYHCYPEDRPEKMKLFSERYGFDFPYLLDETQAVARAYGAVCTPDFFGFNAALELQYRGRLDSAGRQSGVMAVPELLLAMTKIATTGQGPATQYPSVGCSIKWRE